jgi:hypothetical protein
MELKVKAQKVKSADGNILVKILNEDGSPVIFHFENCEVGTKGDILVLMPQSNSEQPYDQLEDLEVALVTCLKSAFTKVSDGVNDSIRIMHVGKKGRVLFKLHMVEPLTKDIEEMCRMSVNVELVGIQKLAGQRRVKLVWKAEVEKPIILDTPVVSDEEDNDDHSNEVIPEDMDEIKARAKEFIVTEISIIEAKRDDIAKKKSKYLEIVTILEEMKDDVSSSEAILTKLGYFEETVNEIRQMLTDNDPLDEIMECIDEYYNVRKSVFTS